MVAPDGGGKLAAIPGYRVAGKTGTAWKATAGGYATDRYLAVFGGVAPASTPRLAAVVVIDEPGAGKYYGGDVAAPVFSRRGRRRVAPAGRAARCAGAATMRANAASRVATPMSAPTHATKNLARLLDGLAELPRDVARAVISRRTAARRGRQRVPRVRGTRRTRPAITRRRRSRTARARCCSSRRRWRVVPDLPSDIVVAPVPRLREHASLIADRFFGAPSRQLSVAGITGTNGKTTCAYLLAQALENARPARGLHGHDRHRPAGARWWRARSPPAMR